MQLPETLLEIVHSADDSDPTEASRRLAQAASSVEDFAATTALNALDDLLQAATLSPADAASASCAALAKQLTEQTATLESEVGRFLQHRRRIFRN